MKLQKLTMTSLCLAGILSFQHLRAQETEPETTKPASGNASQIHVELGGPGVIYSINYDGRLSKKDKGIGVRIGFGAAAASGSSYFALPVGLNYLAGGGGNYFEVGAGATFISGQELDIGDSEHGTFGWLSLGYRRQAYRKKGITWRLAFTPIFGSGYFIPYAGGSIGYRF